MQSVKRHPDKLANPTPEDYAAFEDITNVCIIDRWGEIPIARAPDVYRTQYLSDTLFPGESWGTSGAFPLCGRAVSSPHVYAWYGCGIAACSCVSDSVFYASFLHRHAMFLQTASRGSSTSPPTIMLSLCDGSRSARSRRRGRLSLGMSFARLQSLQVAPRYSAREWLDAQVAIELRCWLLSQSHFSGTRTGSAGRPGVRRKKRRTSLPSWAASLAGMIEVAHWCAAHHALALALQLPSAWVSTFASSLAKPKHFFITILYKAPTYSGRRAHYFRYHRWCCDSSGAPSRT